MIGRIRNYILILLLLCVGATVYGQGVLKKNNKSKISLQEKLALAEQQLQDGDTISAFETYKLIRAIGGIDSAIALIANDSIAWMSYEAGNVEEMYNSINFFAKYLQKYPDDNLIAQEHKTLTEYYHNLKEYLTLTSDLCGIWVSDYTEDHNKVPYFILEIEHTDTGYVGHIHPNCHLAAKYPTYRSINYNYKTISELPIAIMEVYADKDSAYVNFAEKKFLRGCPECAKIGVELGVEMLELAHKTFSDVTSYSDFFYASHEFKTTVYATTLAVAAVGVAVELLSFAISNAKTHAYAISVQLKYVVKGEIECTITENVLETTLDGSPVDLRPKIFKMRLLKNYPDYDTRFIGYNGQLVGSHTFSKAEAKQYPEYKYSGKQIQINNIAAYQRLFDSFRESHKNSPQEIQEHIDTIFSTFYLANEGVMSNCRLPTRYGDFIGRTRYGKPIEEESTNYFYKSDATLQGLYINSSYNYSSIFIGSVKNERREGKGVNYEYKKDTITSALVRETKGSWKNGKLSGYAEQNDYISQRAFNGYFDDGYRSGIGTLMDTFTNRQYKGTWKNFKGYEFLSGHVEERTLEGKLLFSGNYKFGVRYGKGIEYSLDGNRYEGSWKNGYRHGKGIAYINTGPDSEIGVFQDVWKYGKLKKHVKYEE